MKILYESGFATYEKKTVTKNDSSGGKCQKTEEIDKTKIGGYYRSERVVEHNGYKFTYRFICYNWKYFGDHVDKGKQALYVMVNGKWELLLESGAVGVRFYDERYGNTSEFDSARDTLFSKFDEYIEKVY